MWTSQVMFTMTKWPVQKHIEHHKHGVYKDATFIKKLLFFVFFGFFCFFIFNFQLLKGLLQKMLNYRLGTVNEKNWGFKPVFSLQQTLLLYLIDLIVHRKSKIGKKRSIPLEQRNQAAKTTVNEESYITLT